MIALAGFVLGAFAGGIAGLWFGDAMRTGDFDFFTPVFGLAAGALAGALIGTAIGLGVQ